MEWGLNPIEIDKKRETDLFHGRTGEMQLHWASACAHKVIDHVTISRGGFGLCEENGSDRFPNCLLFPPNRRLIGGELKTWAGRSKAQVWPAANGEILRDSNCFKENTREVSKDVHKSPPESQVLHGSQFVKLPVHIILVLPKLLHISVLIGSATHLLATADFQQEVSLGCVVSCRDCDLHFINFILTASPVS